MTKLRGNRALQAGCGGVVALLLPVVMCGCSSSSASSDESTSGSFVTSGDPVWPDDLSDRAVGFYFVAVPNPAASLGIVSKRCAAKFDGPEDFREWYLSVHPDGESTTSARGARAEIDGMVATVHWTEQPLSDDLSDDGIESRDHADRWVYEDGEWRFDDCG